MYKEYTVASQSHINEDRNFKNNNAVTKRLSLYSLPLSEHITGISSQKMNEENIREFPSFSLGVEFELPMSSIMFHLLILNMLPLPKTVPQLFMSVVQVR
jgi:hypothetical protein